MNIVIREMKIDDYDSIRGVWESIPGLKLEEADSRTGIEKYLTLNPNLSYVAISEDKIIGTVLCGQDGRRGYLQHLCVVDKYRNRGVGSKLLDAAIEQFNVLGLHEIRIFVFKNNEVGNRYWARKGWIVRNDIYVRSLKLEKHT